MTSQSSSSGNNGATSASEQKVSITGSVDDHFQKALGNDVWNRLRPPPPQHPAAGQHPNKPPLSPKEKLPTREEVEAAVASQQQAAFLRHYPGAVIDRRTGLVHPASNSVPKSAAAPPHGRLSASPHNPAMNGGSAPTPPAANEDSNGGHVTPSSQAPLSNDSSKQQSDSERSAAADAANKARYFGNVIMPGGDPNIVRTSAGLIPYSLAAASVAAAAATNGTASAAVSRTPSKSPPSRKSSAEEAATNKPALSVHT